jgi:uncharacterized protein
MTPALALFVKAPRAGEVKTRLVPTLGAEQACALHRAFAEDAMALTSDLGAARVLATNDPGDPFIVDLARRAAVPIRAQHPGDLGERMADAIAALAPGHRGVVILGVDCPTVPPSYLREALSRAAAGIVLGPATDGGYYLIGASRAVPYLFHGLRWGGPTVLRDTLERAADASDTLHLLPFWYDVDTPDALALLRAHLRLMPAHVAPATRAALGRLAGGLD